MDIFRNKDAEIKISDEDRKLLKNFFDINQEYILNTNFYEYENIKEFGYIYEKYIDDNNLRDNDIMMLFLVEIRYDQLAYKIGKNTKRMRVKNLTIYGSKLSDAISKWYYESRIAYYVPRGPISGLDNVLYHNKRERVASFEEARKIIVK